MAGPDLMYVLTDPLHWKFEVRVADERPALFVFDAYDKDGWPKLRRGQRPVDCALECNCQIFTAPGVCA